MAETVLDEITDELYQSTWFSIMADESKDISEREQLSVVRYLFDHTLHEEFLGFVRLRELNAEYLKTSICEMLLTCNIDAKNCVGQTYNGASVMSGTNSGVQKLFREEAAPEATYIHCYNHRLNLVIVDVLKSVKIADQFFGLLKSIYVFMSSAVLHELFLQKRNKLFPDKQPQKLKKLSDKPLLLTWLRLHDELEQERKGSNWGILWSKAKDMAKELDIPVRFAHKSGRKRHQSSMPDGFATSTSLGQEETPDSKHDICVNLFYPVLDRFLAELGSRFSEDNKQLLRSVSALDPRSSKFFNAEIIEPMSVQYGVELSDLAVEVRQAKRLIQRKESEGVKITTLV
ncbi:zinc finger MYM-type protein 1-like [Macrobrachium rosenbergii]|uniref:zinc finger MYM-type protein 1-like n=1 Tax=Macrobrachium rosenbergii TaxID=79674 RepID=UPI0034D5F37E